MGTVTVTPEIFHGQRMMAELKAKRLVEALNLAVEGSGLYPAYRLPVTGGGQPTYVEIARSIARKLGVPVPAVRVAGGWWLVAGSTVPYQG